MITRTTTTTKRSCADTNTFASNDCAKEKIAIECIDIEKSYHENRHVLSGITFRVSKGRVVLIVGPSGAGKSTLLNILSGVMQPSSGRVLFYDGNDDDDDDDTVATAIISAADDDNNNSKSKKMKSSSLLISCAWGDNCLYPTMSIINNLRFFATINGLDWKDLAETKVPQLLRDFGIFHDKNRFITNLSSGTQRKVDLCRALLMDSDILLLDDPSPLLDNRSKKSLVKILSDYKNRGKTIVIVTHHASLFSEIADDLLVLKNGILIFNGPISNLVSNREKSVRKDYTDLKKENQGAHNNNDEEKNDEDGGGSSSSSSSSSAATDLDKNNNKNGFILKTSDRLKANEILQTIPQITGTYVSQKAVHIYLEEGEDLYPVLSALASHGLEIKEVITKKQNLDKLITEAIIKHGSSKVTTS